MVVFERISPSGRIEGRRRLVALGLAALTLVALVLAWSDPQILCVLPAFVLAMLLALRRYPGERLLLVVSRARRRSRHALRALAPTGERLESLVPRGSLLLGRSLAVRPPPTAALAVI